MLRRLEELCNINGVSGDEGRVRKYIKEYAKAYSDDIKTDSMGNLYVHKKGKGKRKLLIAAHMDEVGMIVRGVTEQGLLAYDQSGIDPRVAVSKRVAVGKDEVPGVIGAKAIHLQTDDEFKSALKHSQLYIDIGAKDKDDALKYVKLGDYVSFITKFEKFGDNMIKSKALDDRVGCAVACELMKHDYDCDITYVFTVQEEVGCRGANAAVFNVQPELALILEGTTANDMPKMKGHEHVTKVGEGPAVSFMDRGTIVRPEMFNALKETARENNIPFQMRQGTAGGTDGGVIHKGAAGCISGGVSLPCRYIHSPMCVASIKDFENMFALLDAFLDKKKFEEVLKNV